MNVASLAAFVSGRRRLLALMPLVAAAAALVVSLAQPERFQASAELWFGGTTDATSLAAGAAGVATDAEPLAANLALATLDATAARVGRRLPWSMTVAELSRAVDVRFNRNSDLVTVTAESREPSRAALMANAFADEIVALRRAAAQADVQRAIDVLSERIRRRQNDRVQVSGDRADAIRDEIRSLRARNARLELLKSLQTGNVRIVEGAAPPPSPSSPKPLRTALLGSFAGLIAGLLAVALIARTDDRIRDERELTSLIPARVLGRIPEARIRSRPQDRDFADAFQFLSMQLQLMRPEGKGVVLTLTSPGVGDGKTTVVRLLAHSFALNGVEVVAVDCEAVAPGPGSIDPERLRHTLGPIRAAADFVLVDTPPISTVADASVVARATDGVILVVDLGNARRTEVLAAKRQLATARAALLGIVINRAPAPLPAFAPAERARVEREPSALLGPPTFAA